MSELHFWFYLERTLEGRGDPIPKRESHAQRYEQPAEQGGNKSGVKEQQVELF